MTASKIVSALPASLWLRLLAAVYDVLPLLALWFVAAVLALALTGGALDVHRLADKALLQTLAFGVTAAYFIVSWMRGGQTIGMKPWRLRVVRSDGTPPDLAHAGLRFVVALLSLVAVGLGFWWALFDGQGRSWHDIAAGTLVVRVQED
jgi:uncharacterized RDD family membrane protein YckC